MKYVAIDQKSLMKYVIKGRFWLMKYDIICGMDNLNTSSDSKYLVRKIDAYLLEWKHRDHLPLLVKGARQVGKTESILHFGKAHYQSVVYINFVLQPVFRSIIEAGYDVENVIRLMTLIDAKLRFVPGSTLIIFDEIQAAPDVMTTLKSFKIDGRYDVIASGSLLGVHYKQIASLATGYEEEYEMHSMDFEEFLWSCGRDAQFIDRLFGQMLDCQPLGVMEHKVWDELFLEFCVVGGMPAAVRTFVEQGNYQGVVKTQRDILKLYRQDARRYCEGLDSAKILDVYDSTPAQLAKEYKKFQYSSVSKGSSARDYAGCLKWLEDAGLVARAFCMHQAELPIKGNFDPGIFKVYYPDTGLLLASLDEEAALDFKVNRNFHTYKGGIAENIAAEAFLKAGKPLCYFKKENSSLELDFLLRTADALVPIEVKSGNNNAKSMKTAIASSSYPDIHFGIKLISGNIGHENAIYTFPRFCAFLIPRFLARRAS